MNSFQRLLGPWRGFFVTGLVSACLFVAYVLMLGLFSGCTTFHNNEQIVHSKPSPYAVQSHWWYVRPDADDEDATDNYKSK